MSEYPNKSMGANDARNQKLAAIIYILGFIAIHAIAFLIPAQTHFKGWHIAVTVAAFISLLLLVVSFWKNADLTEDFQWPEGVVIILSFASAVLIGWVGDSF